MDHQKVSSPSIESIAYDRDSSTLQIKFYFNGLYNYFNVPEEVWCALMAADSHSQYFHDHIKMNYRYAKVRE